MNSSKRESEIGNRVGGADVMLGFRPICQTMSASSLDIEWTVLLISPIEWLSGLTGLSIAIRIRPGGKADCGGNAADSIRVESSSELFALFFGPIFRRLFQHFKGRIVINYGGSMFLGQRDPLLTFVVADMMCPVARDPPDRDLKMPFT